MASAQLKQRPLIIKCMRGLFNKKYDTVIDTYVQKNLILPKEGRETCNLKMDVINKDIGLRSDRVFEQVETLGHFQTIMDKIREEVEIMSKEMFQYDVIFEYHCMEEILLYVSQVLF